jgi:hypothetical protein
MEFCRRGTGENILVRKVRRAGQKVAASTQKNLTKFSLGRNFWLFGKISEIKWRNLTMVAKICQIF